MAGGIYEHGCDLYESCWIKAIPMGHELWGAHRPATVNFDNNTNAQMVYGVIKGILATLGVLNIDKVMKDLGKVLVEAKDGTTIDKEYELP